MRGKHDTDARIAALAAAQYGVITRAQAQACGLGIKAIEHRLGTARLHIVHRGVYAVGHTRLSGEAQRLAAVLACGDRAVLSHATAAQLWRLRASNAALIDVSVPSTGGRKAPRRVRLHRSATLAAEHCTRIDSLPVTTAGRTMFDLAATLRQRPLERMLHEAEAQLLDTRDLGMLLATYPHHRGAPKLRAALELRSQGPTLTRSELEERFMALCDRAEIKRPRTRRIVCGLEVDFLWQAERLAVETDGREHHFTLEAFERDRERDALLTLAGYRVVRFTYKMVRAQPDRVGVTLRQLLAAT